MIGVLRDKGISILFLSDKLANVFDTVFAIFDICPLGLGRRLDGLFEVRHRNKSNSLHFDALGELGAWWGTADIAYVGGSMGSRGGQNMIEPAAYGVAVSFGPRTENFRDVTQALLTANAAQIVCNAVELQAFVQRCLRDPQFSRQLGERAKRLVASGKGAAIQTVDLLDSGTNAGQRRFAA